MTAEEKLALTQEVVPRIQQSLYLLRILVCIAAAGLALAKILLSPPSMAFILDMFPDNAAGLKAWMRIFNVLVSGFLAVTLALVVATFLIQARLQTLAASEAELPHLE